MQKDQERRQALVYHAKPKPGKIEVVPTKKVPNPTGLSIGLFPGSGHAVSGDRKKG